MTEVFGDLASGEGWVVATGSPRWAKPASELAPIARQVLAGDRAAGLDRRSAVTRLARAATEYHGVVEVQEDGPPITLRWSA